MANDLHQSLSHHVRLVEDIGCITVVYFSLPALFINYIPLIVIALATCGYSGKYHLTRCRHALIIFNPIKGFALRYFFRRRSQFNDVLRFSKSGLSRARFLRLIALLLVMAISSLSLTLYGLIIAIEFQGLQPWVSWSYVHANFNEIFTFKAEDIGPEYTSLWVSSAVSPVFGLLFFVFFGLGGDAFEAYRKAGQWALVHIFRQEATDPRFSIVFSRASLSKAVKSPHMDAPSSETSSVDDEEHQ